MRNLIRNQPSSVQVHLTVPDALHRNETCWYCCTVWLINLYLKATAMSEKKAELWNVRAILLQSSLGFALNRIIQAESLYVGDSLSFFSTWPVHFISFIFCDTQADYPVPMTNKWLRHMFARVLISEVRTWFTKGHSRCLLKQQMKEFDILFPTDDVAQWVAQSFTDTTSLGVHCSYT